MSLSSWNKFRICMKGKGYTMKQLSELYKSKGERFCSKLSKSTTKTLASKTSLKKLPSKIKQSYPITLSDSKMKQMKDISEVDKIMLRSGGRGSAVVKVERIKFKNGTEYVKRKGEKTWYRR